MEKIKNAIILFSINPIQLFKALYFRARPLPKNPVRKRINGVIFEFDFNYDPVVKALYYGTYEIRTIKIMKRFLKKRDIFIDVGANIGYLSAIAMGFVGQSGQVHSFEPVPSHFMRLSNVAEMNPRYKIFVNQYALGDTKGKSKINVTNLPNIGWNIMVSGFMSTETIKETVEVAVTTLGNYIEEKKLNNIALIKIDTEGYELPILRGMEDYFLNNAARPAIICEIAPNAYPLLGVCLSDLSEYMNKYGYIALNERTKKQIDVAVLEKTTNVIFVPRRCI